MIVYTCPSLSKVNTAVNLCAPTSSWEGVRSETAGATVAWISCRSCSPSRHLSYHSISAAILMTMNRWDVYNIKILATND